MTHFDFCINPLDQKEVDAAMKALYALNNTPDGIPPLFCMYKDYKVLKEEKESLLLEKDLIEQERDKFKKELEAERQKTESLESDISSLNNKLQELNGSYKEILDKYNKCKEELDRVKLDNNFSTDEFKYFKVKGDKLEEVIDRSENYIAVKKEDSYEFHFNVENAAHLKAIQNRKELLDPFCEIEGEAAPNPNCVVNKGKGRFSIINGVFKMEEKALISLIEK